MDAPGLMRGIGLSTVLGIIEQHDAMIRVWSVVDHQREVLESRGGLMG